MLQSGHSHEYIPLATAPHRKRAYTVMCQRPWRLVACEAPEDDSLMVPGHELHITAHEMGICQEVMAGRKQIVVGGIHVTQADARLCYETYAGCTFRHTKTREEVTIR